MKKVNMINPIWKKVFVNLGAEDYVDYYINVLTSEIFQTIYSGRAYKKPGESSVKICINDICADWLKHNYPSFAQGFSPDDKPVEFTITKLNDNGSTTILNSYRFIQDWSYDKNHDVERDGLAFPINGHVDSRQWLLWTGLDVSVVDAEITLANGTILHDSISVESGADFNNDFNADFAKSLSAAGSGTAVFKPAIWGDAIKVVVNGVEYKVVKTCSRYVLYYLNAYGGWDSLLIEGASSERDNLTRHTMSKGSLYDRTETNYLNEITKKITMHTSWMSDDESARMHNLLNSTDVYLHDLVSNDILPVILDNTETSYKTYQNQGGKLVNYTIDVTIAQSRMRR